MVSRSKRKKLIRLIEKYQKGVATPEEAAFVEAYYRHFDSGDAANTSLSASERQEQEDRLFESLQARIRQPPQAPPIVLLQQRTYLRVAAAVLLLILGSVAYRYMGKRKLGEERPPVAAITHPNDIAPGGNKAILTLANGATIVLDSTTTGHLAQQGSVRIAKHSSGEIVYSGATKGAVMYNTMTTQRGGQYRLQLPDGTKVWLNSASSIHYPVTFTGGRREVDITGEVYFEVAKEKIPFIVHVNQGMQVEVLGTHFNIMAYPDEAAIRTTLLEGSVIVRDRDRQALLAPGQQAVLGALSSPIKVNEADTDKETAWISGFFQFDHTDLPALMRQLQRWYDVDPVYDAKDTGRRFGGRISRNLRLSEMLHLLESNDIHFKIEGKKLIVQQ